ncbi:MAG TPA: hypothetical protein VGS06_28240 [Streptosporangiaceae bacterium]|nr:hypothetical protein [Streptosporangiaceae bacterium]
MAQNALVAVYDDIGKPAVARLNANYAFGQGTLVISAVPGRLCRVHIITALVGVSSTITIYDSASAASGNVLWALTVAGANNVVGGVIPVDLPVFNGIVVTNASATAGALALGYV